MAIKSTPWSLSGSRFTLSCGQLAAESDLRDFVVGLTNLKWGGSPLEMRLLGPQLPQLVNGEFAITECFVRGADLVVSCERPGPLNLVPQFYWRARQIESRAAVAIELILSMRTDLLDSQPRTSIETLVRCDEVLSSLRLEASAFRPAAPGTTLERSKLAEGKTPAYLFRNSGVSYLEMVHPDDFCAVDHHLSRNGHHRIVSTVFPESLEKGVIRRARICGWFMPAENDLQTAVDLAKRFVDEPLPLTT